MSDIRDNVLYSRETWEGEGNGEMNWSTRFITRVLDLVREELGESGDRDWMVDAVEERSVRISHIEGLSRRVASGLYRLGLRPGDVLHTAYNTRLDFFWPAFGAWLGGAAVSVSDPQLSVEVVRTQLEDTRANIVVISHSAMETFRAANSLLNNQVKHILVIDVEPWVELPPGCSSFRSLYNDDGLACPKPSSLPEYNPEEVAIIHWTSGTTGVPKGVQHTQKYLHLSLRKSKVPMRSGSLQSNTMFHVGAFLLPLDGGIRNRFTCYIVQEKHFSPERIVEVIAKYKPLFYMANPYHVQALSTLTAVDADVSSLFCIMPSGGQCTLGCIQNLHSLFPGLKIVFHFYGGTEVGPVSWTFDVSSGCLGVLMPGSSAYISNPETGAKQGPGEAGEIMVSTLYMMKGYLNRDQANKEFFAGDGYSHTGDLGYFDSEGKLYFKDRAKEIIKVTSRWIGPGELEDTIEQVNGVLEACVWSTYDKERCDDIIHTAVVLRSGSKLTKDDIRDHVKNNTEPHMHLTGDVFFMDQIPHNPQGKKLRRILKTQYLEQKLIAGNKSDL